VSADSGERPAELLLGDFDRYRRARRGEARAAARACEAVAAAFIEAQGSLQLGAHVKDRRRRCRVRLGHERAWLLLLGSVGPWRLGRWAGAGRAFGLGPVGKDMIFYS
jgi:hypothetical protein